MLLLKAWLKALLFQFRYTGERRMPRQAPCEDVSSLRARKAALGASRREGHARLRKEQKAACARRSRELAARRRALERACAILALHESDRAWLPAFMREHGMSGTGEELTAFDQDLCSKFLSLAVDEINRIRAPTEHRAAGMLRDARAFIAKHQLHAWLTQQNKCHGIAPTVGDTLIQRGELSAAQISGDGEQPMWSVATSARYKWATHFRWKWRLGTRKPQAREVVPVHVAREKADTGKLGGRFQHGMQVSARFSGHASHHPERRAPLGGRVEFPENLAAISSFSPTTPPSLPLPTPGKSGPQC